MHLKKITDKYYFDFIRFLTKPNKFKVPLLVVVSLHNKILESTKIELKLVSNKLISARRQN